MKQIEKLIYNLTNNFDGKLKSHHKDDYEGD